MISKKGYQPEGTEEVFVVSCVVPEIVYTYRVKEVDNTPVRGPFYKQDLQKVQVPDEARYQDDKI